MDETIFFERPKQGLYVYHSNGCGDEVEIRIASVEWNEPLNVIYLSVQETEELISCLKLAIKESKDEIVEINASQNHHLEKNEED